MENWRPSPYDDYEASDLGRIRSVDRVTVRSNGTKMTYSGRVLTPKWTGTGSCARLHVNLGRSTTRLVHVVVLETFVGPRPPGMLGCHNNGDVTNNTPDNLRWDTQGSNMLDAVKHGTHVSARKTECPRHHPLVAPNLVPSFLPRRNCLACNRARRHVCRHPELADQLGAISDRYFEELMKQ